MPNYFTFLISLLTYIVFIGIPVLVIYSQTNRLRLYDLACKGMFGLTISTIVLKIFYVEELSGESFGVFVKVVTDDQTGLVT